MRGIERSAHLLACYRWSRCLSFLAIQFPLSILLTSHKRVLPSQANCRNSNSRTSLWLGYGHMAHTLSTNQTHPWGTKIQNGSLWGGRCAQGI